MGLLFFLPGMIVPRWWCGRDAPGLFRGDFAAYAPLAAEVAKWVEAGVTEADFATGNWQFNGEWAFGAYQMAGLGFCQLIEQFPDRRAEFQPLAEKAITQLLRKDIREFDTRSWQEDPLETLDGDKAHVAYLGYLNLVLSLYRQVAQNPQFNDFHDRITNKLVRLLEQSDILLLETYPGEIYPIDNTSAIGSIALYDKVCGTDHRPLLERWLARCRQAYIDPKSGLLIQAINPKSGAWADKPRASGTALGAYFLSFADRGLSLALYEAMKRSCRAGFAGFGALREYPLGIPAGVGDIDSGPLVFGLSMSATGFVLSSARIHRDEEFFTELYRQAFLAGYPVDRKNGRYFSLGGPLGTAIMLAMTTAGGPAR